MAHACVRFISMPRAAMELPVWQPVYALHWPSLGKVSPWISTAGTACATSQWPTLHGTVSPPA